MAKPTPWKLQLGQIAKYHLLEALSWKALGLESASHLLLFCWPWILSGNDLCHWFQTVIPNKEDWPHLALRPPQSAEILK